VYYIRMTISQLLVITRACGLPTSTILLGGPSDQFEPSNIVFTMYLQDYLRLLPYGDYSQTWATPVVGSHSEGGRIVDPKHCPLTYTQYLSALHIHIPFWSVAARGDPRASACSEEQYFKRADEGASNSQQSNESLGLINSTKLTVLTKKRIVKI
jgi:hypothetical protein